MPPRLKPPCACNSRSARHDGCEPAFLPRIWISAWLSAGCDAAAAAATSQVRKPRCSKELRFLASTPSSTETIPPSHRLYRLSTPLPPASSARTPTCIRTYLLALRLLFAPCHQTCTHTCVCVHSPLLKLLCNIVLEKQGRNGHLPDDRERRRRATRCAEC